MKQTRRVSHDGSPINERQNAPIDNLENMVKVYLSPILKLRNSMQATKAKSEILDEELSYLRRY